MGVGSTIDGTRDVDAAVDGGQAPNDGGESGLVAVGPSGVGAARGVDAASGVDAARADDAATGAVSGAV